MTILKLKLDEITVHASAQLRFGMNKETIEEYTEALIEGSIFPPVIVFFDGNKYYLADGFHRFSAHKNTRADKVDIQCDIRKGSLRDAILYSAGANYDHGLQRTNSDKRKAVATMFGDAKWALWSDIDIAKHCKVSRMFVYNLRNINKDTEEGKCKRLHVNSNTLENTLPTDEVSNISTSAAFQETDKDTEPDRSLFKSDVAPDTFDESFTDDEMPTEAETLSFEIKELQTTNSELLHKVKELEDRNAELECIFNSNDKLSEAIKDADHWKKQFHTNQLICNQFQIDLNEHKKSHEYWRKQAGKLKHELDAIKRLSVGKENDF